MESDETVLNKKGQDHLGLIYLNTKENNHLTTIASSVNGLGRNQDHST